MTKQFEEKWAFCCCGCCDCEFCRREEPTDTLGRLFLDTTQTEEVYHG